MDVDNALYGCKAMVKLLDYVEVFVLWSGIKSDCLLQQGERHDTATI